MPHIDEGVLHAYLDGALEDVAAAGELADAMTAADVVTHFELCADCRARLEAERSIREQAGMILRDVAVPHVRIPDVLPALQRAKRRRVVPLAWAASLFMAVTAGWFAGMQMRERTASLAEMAPMTSSESTAADAAARAVPDDASNEVRSDDAIRSAAPPQPIIVTAEPPPTPAPAAPVAPVQAAARMQLTAEASKAAAQPPTADVAAGGVAAQQRAAFTADELAAPRREVLGLEASVNAQQRFDSIPERTTAEGCYRFDRPLGHSASGDRERADSSWYYLELREGGAVGRPHLESAFWRDEYARISSWRAAGDTLFIRVTTGLVGWDLTLVPEGFEYVGRARYVTDAIAVGAAPLFVPVRGVRSACE